MSIWEKRTQLHVTLTRQIPNRLTFPRRSPYMNRSGRYHIRGRSNFENGAPTPPIVFREPMILRLRVPHPDCPDPTGSQIQNMRLQFLGQLNALRKAACIGLPPWLAKTP